jgi:hypothetical protein
VQGNFIISRVASGADEKDGAVGAAGVGAQGGGDVGTVTAAEQSDGEVPTDGEGLWRRAGADLAAVFVEGDVPDVVGLVLDAPMAPREGEEVGRIGLIGGQAGDADGHFRLDLAGGLADAAALEAVELPGVRPGPAHRAGIPDAGILGGIGQRPEDAPLEAPVPGLGRSIHGDRGCGAALLPRALLPADARRAAVQSR